MKKNNDLGKKIQALLHLMRKVFFWSAVTTTILSIVSLIVHRSSSEHGFLLFGLWSLKFFVLVTSVILVSIFTMLFVRLASGYLFSGVLLVLFSGFLSIVLVNQVMEFFPHWFPENLVQYFTITAKKRYGQRLSAIPLNAEKTAQMSVLTHSIRRFKPGAVINTEKKIEFVADEKGYRNPVGYYSKTDKIDIALFGDSMVYSSESQITIADFLRRELLQKTVYSFGMLGEGPSHWIKHYQFGGGKEKSPKVLILNFYEGNDLDDLCLYKSLQDGKGNVDAYTYYSSLGGRYKKHNHIYNILFGNVEGLYKVTKAMLHHRKDKSYIVKMGQMSFKFQSIRRAIYMPQCIDEMEVILKEFVNTTPEGSLIILSYIPTNATLYGPYIEGLDEKYSRSRETYKKLSSKLKQICKGIGIIYWDFTPELMKYASKERIWANEHFNERGYELYSILIARELKKLWGNKLAY